MDELQENSLNKDKNLAEELKKLKTPLQAKREEQLGLKEKLRMLKFNHEKKVEDLSDQKSSFNKEKLALKENQMNLAQELSKFGEYFKKFRQQFLIHMVIWTRPEWNVYFGGSNLNNLEKDHEIGMVFIKTKMYTNSLKIDKLDQKIEDNDNQMEIEIDSYSKLKSENENLLHEKEGEIRDTKEEMFEEDLEKLAKLDLQLKTVEEILK